MVNVVVVLVVVVVVVVDRETHLHRGRVSVVRNDNLQ